MMAFAAIMGGPTLREATKGRLIKNSPSSTRQMFRVKGEARFQG
jgi:hypothetical protein